MLEMGRMGILFFTKGNKTVPSSRYRVWLVAERLQKQYGWKYDILHSIGYSAFSISFSRFKLLFTLGYKLRTMDYDLLFVHKSLYPWDVILFVLVAKKLFRKKLIYDLDDAEWVHSPRKSVLLAQQADAVFCGSHEILHWAEKYNHHALLMPTVLDAELYAAHTVLHTSDKVCTIGWIGQGRVHFKAGNFTILKEVLARLYSKGILFRFIVVGSQHYQPLHDFFSDSVFEVIFVDEAEWAEEDIVPKIISQYQFDIGVMPLVDTLFNRAKCAFKAIEYMACGVPVVASPVGEAMYVVRSGKNGMLAATEDEWVSVTEKLVLNAQLRQKMGSEGQNIIRDSYSFQDSIPRIREEIVKIYK